MLYIAEIHHVLFIFFSSVNGVILPQEFSHVKRRFICGAHLPAQLVFAAVEKIFSYFFYRFFEPFSSGVYKFLYILIAAV